MLKLGTLIAGALAALMLGGAAARAAELGCQAPRPDAHGPVRILASGVTSRSVAFSSPCGRVTGEIVEGAGRNSHPAVLFVHWLGDPKTTNHAEFEADAVALARRGVTSLLIDAMWAKPGWFDTVGVSAAADAAQGRRQLDGLKASLEVLERQKGVDPARIAYVGHDFGAMFGALLLGEDARPRVAVLMAGVPTMSEWYVLGKTHPDKDSYVRALDGSLDVAGALGRIKTKAILLQFAAHDRFIAPDRAAAFAAASPLPRGVFTYDADHSLNVPQAVADRRAWLLEQLLPPRQSDAPGRR